MSDFNDPRSTDQLIRELLTRDLQNDHAAWDLIFVLQHRLKEIFPKIAALTKGDRSSRDVAATVLGQNSVKEKVLPRECVRELAALLQAEQEQEIISFAISSLGHLCEYETLDLLLKYVAHPQEDVRFSVALALERFDDDRAINALVELSKDTSSDVRDWATHGLAKSVDTPLVRDALADRLKDADNDTRGEALVGLAIRLDPRVIEPLRAEFQAYKEGRCQTEILFPLEAAEIVVKSRAKLSAEWSELLLELDQAQVGMKSPGSEEDDS